MNRLKRLISFVVVLCMMTTLGGYFGLAEEPVVQPMEQTNEMRVLAALGILEPEQQELTRTVSRSEFANALVKTVQEELGSFEVFGDLGSNDAGMNWLYQAGMLHGNGAGEFRPADAITVSEATKLALGILGYGALAEEEGGYPAGYAKIANRVDLMDGVKGAFGAELTYQDCVAMLYALIHIEIMEPIGYHTDGYVKYKMGGVHTLLEVYRDIYKGTGIVDANEVSGLYNTADKTPAGILNVGEDLLDASVVYDKYGDMIGHRTDYWYYKQDDSKKELLVMVPVDETSLLIPADDILSYSNGTYCYEDKNEKTMEVSVSNETTILYNGENIIDNSVFKPEIGCVELIDNNRDGRYDVLKVRDKQLIIVQGSYEKNGVFSVYDMFDAGKNLSLDLAEDASYRLYDVNGASKELTDIAAGNVLEVETTKSSPSYRRITLVTDSKVAKIQSEMNKKYLTDIGEFETTSRFDLLLSKKEIEVQLGEMYTLYLASDGKVVYVAEGEASDTLLTYRLGYLHRTAEIESAFSKTWEIRVLDESGAWENFELAERLLIDGVETKRKDIKNLSSNEGSLVRYLLNIQGEVIEMYFPKAIPANSAVTEMDDKFQTIYEHENARYRYYPSGYIFGSSLNSDNIVQVPDTSKIFVKPKTMTAKNSANGYFKEEYIGIGTALSFLKDGSNYMVTACSVSAIPGIVDVALVSTTEERFLKEMERAVAINEVVSAIDEEGEKCFIVTALYNGTPTDYHVYDRRTKQEDLPFGAGDIVFLYTDVHGKCMIYDDIRSGEYKHGNGWKMLCDYKETGLDPYLNRDRFSGRQPVVKVTDGGNRVKYGTVYDVNGNNILINTTNNARDWQTVEALKVSGSRAHVYVWDEKKETFRAGTAYDAICAKYDPVNASKAYVVDYNQFIVVALYPAESV